MRSTRMWTTCVRCALQVFATEIQEKDGDEEEIPRRPMSPTPTSEKKIQEQKKARGYFPPT